MASLRPHVRPLGGDRDEIDAGAWRHWFAASPLSALEIDTLRGMTRVEFVASGDAVFTAGDSAHDLVLLVSGDVSLGTFDAKGVFRAERNVQGPAWLDGCSAWLGRAHVLNAQAVNNLRVARIPVSSLNATLAREPELAAHIIKLLASQVLASDLVRRDLTQHDAAARLAAWLLQHSGADTELVRLHHRKRDMAAELAITPETLSRLMGRFTRSGMISVRGYSIHLLDRDALRALVQ